MKFVLRAVFLAAALAAILSGGTAAHAQAYPSRPISLVIPYTVGGSVDYVGRIFAGEFAQKLGQPVIVQNLPGGGGTVGSQFVAKSAADGYTLLITNPTPVTSAVGLPYDPVRAFVLIAPVTGPSDKFPIFSVFAPAGTPPATIARLASAIKDSLATTSLQGQFAKAGLQVAAAGQGGRAAVLQKSEPARPVASTNPQQSREDALAAQQKAANAGDSAAMMIMAYRYDTGADGYTKSDEQALAWYRKAADAGNASAMSMLGGRYVSGQGVAKDWEQAAIWYRKAAELGDAGAMHMVALTYDNGLGVAKDFNVAMSWYRRAADAGDVSAMCDIALKYLYGNGVPQNKSEAIAWYRKAAAKGFAPAKDQLAKLDVQPVPAQQAGNAPAPSQARAPAYAPSAPTPAPAASSSDSGDSPFADALVGSLLSQTADTLAQSYTGLGSMLGGFFSSLADSVQQNGTAGNEAPATSSDSGDSPVADALTGALLSHAADVLTQGDTGGGGSVLGGFFSNLAEAVQQGGGSSSSATPTARTDTPGAGAASGRIFVVTRETREDACATSKSFTIKAGLVPGNCVCDNLFNAINCHVETSANAPSTATGSAAPAGKLTTAQLKAIAQQCQKKVESASALSGNSNNTQYETQCKLAAFDMCIYQDTNHQVSDYNQEAKVACSIVKSAPGGSSCPSTCDAVARLPVARQ